MEYRRYALQVGIGYAMYTSIISSITIAAWYILNYYGIKTSDIWYTLGITQILMVAWAIARPPIVEYARAKDEARRKRLSRLDEGGEFHE